MFPHSFMCMCLSMKWDVPPQRDLFGSGRIFWGFLWFIFFDTVWHHYPFRRVSIHDYDRTTWTTQSVKRLLLSLGPQMLVIQSGVYRIVISADESKIFSNRRRLNGSSRTEESRWTLRKLTIKNHKPSKALYEQLRSLPLHFTWMHANQC